MSALKKWILVALISLCSPAYANTYLPDYSDLWWNALESGWGVTVTHQNEVVFLTFFVYGTDGRATWYTGQASYASQTETQNVFTGDMYQVSGPYFGASFDPARVNARKVGAMTFTASAVSASLRYSIDGVTVTKALTRQTFRDNDVSGAYMGAIKQTQSGCQSSGNNGDFNSSADFSVSSTPAGQFYMTIRQPNGSSCAYSGIYKQQGRLGQVDGTYNCSSGVSGAFSADRIEANFEGIVGRYTAFNNYCSAISGRFGAMRK